MNYPGNDEINKLDIQLTEMRIENFKMKIF